MGVGAGADRAPGINHSNVTAVLFAGLPAHETDVWLIDVPYGAAYPNRTLVLTVVRTTSSYLLPVVFGGTQGTDVLDVQYPRVCRSTTCGSARPVLSPREMGTGTDTSGRMQLYECPGSPVPLQTQYTLFLSCKSIGLFHVRSCHARTRW
jgi:hypothetical protein